MPKSRRALLSAGAIAAPFVFANPTALFGYAMSPIKGRLGIVVGHTNRRPGAFGAGILNMHEYPFNTVLAAEITGIALKIGLEVKTFRRDFGGVKAAYENAIKWGADAVVELHFNATRKKVDDARGTEMLCAGGARIGSYQLADAVQRHTLRALNRPPDLNRGVKMCKLRGKYPVPAILTEPAFGNNAADANLLAIRRGHCAKAVVFGFIDFQKQKLLPQSQRVLPPDEKNLPDHVTS